MWTELTENQTRQYIDAAGAFEELRRVRASASEVRGGMIWREISGHTYLIRTHLNGSQTSLGRRTPELEQIFARFQQRKVEHANRLARLEQVIDEHERMNKALRVGRAPSIVVRVLNQLDRVGLSDQLLPVGTHSLYAYEAAAGVRFEAGAMATQDIDLLFDTRKRMAFASRLQRLDGSLIKALQKADPTFKVRPDKLETAVNASGFEVDIIRRRATGSDPNPLRVSDDVDDFWAVQISTGEQILAAPRFSQVVVSVTGQMAYMQTMHPLTFIAVKQQIAASEDRDPLKRRKDLLQARLVEQILESHLPQFRAPGPKSDTPRERTGG